MDQAPLDHDAFNENKRQKDITQYTSFVGVGKCVVSADEYELAIFFEQIEFLSHQENEANIIYNINNK